MFRNTQKLESINDKDKEKTLRINSPV